MEPRETADRLLDAQVEFVLGELTGKRLARAIARDVDDLLELGAKLTVADVVDPDAAKRMLRWLVERVGGSTLLRDLATALSDAIYDISASTDYNLGEVVARGPVDALVVKVLSLHALHDRALERLAESPLVATVATRFVAKIVGDFLNQDRQLVEKLPGAKSLISFGVGAVNKVRSATVDQFLGDAAGKGTQFAIHRTTSAIRDLLREAPLHGAVMEIWDQHADEPISDLREYMSRAELRELVVLVHDLITSARSSEYAGGALVDECVDVFFAQYSARDFASLLRELGITRDALVHDLRELLPPIIEAARADGCLESLVRARLKPFFASKQVRTILTGEQPPTPTRKPKPRPAKKAG